MAADNSTKLHPNTKDESGKVYGKLTVLGQVTPPPDMKGPAVTWWKCLCVCGATTIVRGRHLRSGNIKSCGQTCGHIVHGHGRRNKLTSEYRSWASMKNRCYDKKHVNYSYYGGRGITVCRKWIESFVNFLADMGPKPSRQHSIDRIDNDGNYEPENCRWATKSEQGNNRRGNHILTYNGITQPIGMWAQQIGIGAPALRKRLSHWSVERALTTPPDLKHVHLL